MKWTPSSTARRRTASARLRSRGGPQMPSPVRRIAPKPRRCTESSPPSETVPAAAAENVLSVTSHLRYGLTCHLMLLESTHSERTSRSIQTTTQGDVSTPVSRPGPAREPSFAPNEQNAKSNRIIQLVLVALPCENK